MEKWEKNFFGHLSFDDFRLASIWLVLAWVVLYCTVLSCPALVL